MAMRQRQRIEGQVISMSFGGPTPVTKFFGLKKTSQVHCGVSICHKDMLKSGVVIFGANSGLFTNDFRTAHPRTKPASKFWAVEQGEQAELVFFKALQDAELMDPKQDIPSFGSVPYIDDISVEFDALEPECPSTFVLTSMSGTEQSVKKMIAMRDALVSKLVTLDRELENDELVDESTAERPNSADSRDALLGI